MEYAESEARGGLYFLQCVVVSWVEILFETSLDNSH